MAGRRQSDALLCRMVLLGTAVIIDDGEITVENLDQVLNLSENMGGHIGYPEIKLTDLLG